MNEGRLVVTDHHAQAELLNPLRGHRQANQSATELRHEIDGFGSGLFGRHAEVALVLAVFIIHQDDHAAAAGLFERFFDSDEGRARSMDAWRYFPEHKSFLVATAARQLSPGDPYIANSSILSQSRARREPSRGSSFSRRNAPVSSLFGAAG
jgi:hypothetical protein